MVADTTETIEKSYARFVPAARDAAQHQMANGLGIEERASLAAQRGKKVVGFPSRGSAARLGNGKLYVTVRK